MRKKSKYTNEMIELAILKKDFNSFEKEAHPELLKDIFCWLHNYKYGGDDCEDCSRYYHCMSTKIIYLDNKRLRRQIKRLKERISRGEEDGEDRREDLQFGSDLERF